MQGGDGEFWGIFTPFYTIIFRGWHKSGGARATVASPSLAPLSICLNYRWYCDCLSNLYLPMHERGNNKGLFSCLLSKLSCAMISLLKKKYFSYASYAMRKIIMRRHQYMYLKCVVN